MHCCLGSQPACLLVSYMPLASRDSVEVVHARVPARVSKYEVNIEYLVGESEMRTTMVRRVRRCGTDRRKHTRAGPPPDGEDLPPAVWVAFGRGPGRRRFSGRGAEAGLAKLPPFLVDRLPAPTRPLD